MERLQGRDAYFLYQETPTALMHTLKIHIVSSRRMLPGVQQLREHLEKRLHLIPLLRRRVVFVPFGLHHPVFIEDPDFDLDFHICRAALPSPGGMQELDEMVAQIDSHTLDRSRPLWELWVLEGLDGDRRAYVHKIHHALADGMASLGIIGKAWEAEPPDEPASVWQPDPIPSARKLVWDALIDHVKYDARHFPAFLRTFVHNVRALIQRNKTAQVPGVNPFKTALPRTRFNYALTARRSFATTTIALEEIRELKSKLGGTINDVVLALAAGAVRFYLQKHDELPDAPLSVTIPVAADDAGVKRLSGNNVANMSSLLHVELADPVARFQAIQAASQAGKEELAALGKKTFGQLLQYVPPGLFSWSSRRAYRTRPADKPDFRVMSNMIVSCVPGPREKLGGYTGGMEAFYSIGTLFEGIGLNITAWSYVHQMNFSVLACKKAVPDIHRLADCIQLALQELRNAAGADSVLHNEPGLSHS